MTGARAKARADGRRVVAVTVKPGSRRGPSVEAAEDGSLTVCVREPAVDGKATAAAAVLLAEHLGVAKSKVALLAGATSRIKRFAVSE